jgi:3-hydroxyacyl-[acyl-carrier-protein] dehydratase
LVRLACVTTQAGLNAGEFLVLAAVNEMRFLAPVFPGQTMILEITIVKMLPEVALVEGIVTVEDTVVTKGKLSFARKTI